MRPAAEFGSTDERSNALRIPDVVADDQEDQVAVCPTHLRTRLGPSAMTAARWPPLHTPSGESVLAPSERTKDARETKVVCHGNIGAPTLRASHHGPFDT